MLSVVVTLFLLLPLFSFIIIFNLPFQLLTVVAFVLQPQESSQARFYSFSLPFPYVIERHTALLPLTILNASDSRSCREELSWLLKRVCFMDLLFVEGHELVQIVLLKSLEFLHLRWKGLADIFLPIFLTRLWSTALPLPNRRLNGSASGGCVGCIRYSGVLTLN